MQTKNCKSTAGFPKTFSTPLDILTDEAGVLRWTLHVFVGHLKMTIRVLHFKDWSECNSYVSNQFKWYFPPHFKWLYLSVDLVEPKILTGHFVWRSRSLSSDIFKFRRTCPTWPTDFRKPAIAELQLIKIYHDQARSDPYPLQNVWCVKGTMTSVTLATSPRPWRDFPFDLHAFSRQNRGACEKRRGFPFPQIGRWQGLLLCTGEEQGPQTFRNDSLPMELSHHGDNSDSKFRCHLPFNSGCIE